jgi:membrane protease YdiL (CAAX protease family)
MNGTIISSRPASISLLRIFAMITMGYLVMGNVIAMLVITLLYDGNLVEAVTNPADHPEIRNVILLAQGLASFVGLVLIPWYYLRVFEKKPLKIFFGKLPSGLWFGILSFTVVAFAIAISPVAEWNANAEFPAWAGSLGRYLKDLEDQAEVLVKLLTSNMSPVYFSFVFLVVAVIAGVGEELVFRGFVQTEFVRAFKNPHLGIWLAAVFFSAFHMQFFGFFPRLLIGAMLGYLYFWSGNLWIPIICHFLNNGLQVIGLYLYQLNIHHVDMESTDSAPLALVAVSFVATAGLLFYCKNNLPLLPKSSGDSPSQLQ